MKEAVEDISSSLSMELGLTFLLNGHRYSIHRVDIEKDVIVCISKTKGFTPFTFQELESLLEVGDAAFVLG